MSPEFWRRHWPGIALGSLGVAAIISLGLAGRLSWYVHPRYEAFTLAMAGLGAVGLVGSLAVLALRGGVDHGANPAGAEDVRPVLSSAARRLRTVASGALVAAAFGCLALLPPATLSAASTAQRPLSSDSGAGLGAAGQLDASAAVPSADGVPDTERSMRDWSLLLRQHDASLLTARSARVLGFVTADADDPQSTFIVTRFVVTCCAVDAQPIGVPVYLPDWQSELRVDDWVEVEGVFTENPSVVSAWPAAVLPSSVEQVAQPKDPYVS